MSSGKLYYAVLFTLTKTVYPLYLTLKLSFKMCWTSNIKLGVVLTAWP